MPSIKTFAAARPYAPSRANGDIARDFMDLSMKLESGRDLPVLTRFVTLSTANHRRAAAHATI